MTVETKVITSTNHSRSKQRDVAIRIPSNYLELARENGEYKVELVCVSSSWLKNWFDIFKPSTNRSNDNRVIPFESHLKTALFTKTNKMYSPLRVE